ncbi:type II secretion system protein GspM [uncultured Amphritea sp.]|mgnify:FL=1|uniref:type II secretion system protein GspM n=1 Tax=uncultured Amphritea sp. TaxID=981605 RepID=UPI0025F90976|nr:type II secretion system protein GspM [uncultured Amphritea sp.]
MISQLNLRQRQGLALALLCILLLLVYLLLLHPYINSYREYGDRISSLEQQYEIYERLTQGAEQAEQELRALQRDRSTAEYYLPESKPALAAASLQQLLSSVIRQSGGQVVSTNIINLDDDSPLLKVGIQLHLKLEISELVPLLHRLESGTPLLLIESFSITADLRQSRQQTITQNNPRRARQQVPSEGQIDVRFRLIGYAIREVSS